MKVAVVSDEGIEVSRHFGRARYYLVFSVESGTAGAPELRSKFGHHDAQSDEHHAGGDDSVALATRHGSMIDAIRDCDVVIAGGMGEGAYQSLRASGIEVAFVQSVGAEAALQDYLGGRTVERHLCRH